MIALLCFISNSLLFLICPELLSVGIFSDILVLLLVRSKKAFFWYSISKTTTGLLYLSFLLETGEPYTYGGDDKGFVSRYINTTVRLSTKELFSGAYINYPLFYLANKALASVLTFIPIKYIHIALTLVNNALFSIVVLNYSKVLKLLNINRRLLYWSVLPILYFSSIFVRDVYIYCFFSFVLLFLVRGDMTVIKLFLLIALTFLVRPESAIILLVFCFARIQKHQRFLVTVLVVLAILYLLPVIKDMFRNFEQLQEIYFNSMVINESGLSHRLQAIPGVLGGLVWYVYNLFKPLPPYFVSVQNFENFLQIWPNLVIYFFTTVMIYSLLFSRQRLNVLSVVWFYLASVAVVAFVGGTQRHYVHLIVLLVVSFYLQSKKDRINATSLFLVLLPVAVLGYNILT